jgi:hypothetical protein
MDNIAELERLVSVRLMQEDAETIYSLLSTERDSVFAMEIIPYYALFVQSCQEYMGGNFLPEETALSIKDIRNHIKSYSEPFGKSKRKVASIDQEQDASFKSQLRFDFLKSWNVHLNLGTYWTADHHIIGNTQQLAASIDVKNILDPEARTKQYELGYQIGSFVASVRSGLSTSLGQPVVDRPITAITIKNYYDINTNRRNAIFVDHASKELNLFYLHLLCNMNFVKHILRPLFHDGNTWAFRIEYVVTYYTLRALQRLKNYCENNYDVVADAKGIERIVDVGNELFQSKFRNCMMHYNLENQGVLSLEHIEQPFFGIIENCFAGKDYQTYLALLHNLSDQIILFLEKYFNFADVELKQL